MGYLKIHNDKVTSVNADLIANICPFGAIEKTDNGLQINAACKMCRLCVKKSGGIVEYVEQTANSVDKTQYNGIAVFGEIVSNVLHPVTYELLAKARQLSIDSKTNQPVYLLLLGRNVEVPDDLLQAGADRIFVYDNSVFKDFLIDVYTDAFVDFVNRVKPSSVLVASTNLGRVLAPKVAAHFRTGLTADCTMLQMKPNSDLVQIRPAFGGNIMAQIVTPNNRPQFATVRYKIFDRLDKTLFHSRSRASRLLPKQSRITCLNSHKLSATTIC